MNTNTTKQGSTLKVALLGCGQIADAHLQEIRKIPFARTVAVCDAIPDLAEQAAIRFEIPHTYSNLEEMLNTEKPDVVHITTPAHTHAHLTKIVLRAGSHAYVEKPFTIDAHEAREIIQVAEESHKLVCVGHDQLFDPTWLDVKKRIQNQEIGQIKHIHSLLAYPLSGQFGSQVLNDPNHWVRKLPGGLFQNTISHPLYRMTDYLMDENPIIHAHAFSVRPDIPFPTELRVSIVGKEVTAALTFLTTIKPARRVTWLYGTKGSIEVDFDSQIIKRSVAPRLPGALQKLDDPWLEWSQAAINFRKNFWRFLQGNIHYFAGMQELFRRFYHSILHQQEPPICHQEMIRVTAFMDQIFSQYKQTDIQNPRTVTQTFPTINHH